MTIAGVIALVDDIKPNAFGTAAKIAWLSQCEGLVQTEIWFIAIEDVVSYPSDTDLNTELLVSPPHDKIYQAYLMAMIDFANGEYDLYQNTMQVFNAWFREYQQWYANRYRPADWRAEPWKGYYYTAYGIAVKHGFQGTEEQWLESLQGEPGEQGPQGLQGLQGPMGPQGERGAQGPAGGAVNPVFFISDSYGKLCSRETGAFAVLEDVVDAYLSGAAYFLMCSPRTPVRIAGFTISEGGTYGQILVDVFYASDGAHEQFIIAHSTKADFNAAMEAYLSE